MNKTLAILALMFPLSAAAQVHHANRSERPIHEGEIPWTLSSTFTLTSEYMDRGVSASNEHPTLQTEFTLAHDSGVYVGTWLSGIDYKDGQSNIELDYYAGYGTDLTERLWMDAYIIRYSFPGADRGLDYDFFELVGALGYRFDMAEVTATLYYTPRNFADSGNFFYPNLAAKVPLPQDFYLSGEAGYLDIDDEGRYLSPDYAHWRLGIGYEVDAYDLRLDYHDTDLTEAECIDVCGPRFVLSLSRSF